MASQNTKESRKVTWFELLNMKQRRLLLRYRTVSKYSILRNTLQTFFLKGGKSYKLAASNSHFLRQEFDNGVILLGATKRISQWIAPTEPRLSRVAWAEIRWMVRTSKQFLPTLSDRNIPKKSVALLLKY